MANIHYKLTVLQTELTKVEDEIESLINALTGASPILLFYANGRSEELDNRKQEISRKIGELSTEAVSAEQIQQISDYLETWENVSLNDKRRVVDLIISAIYVTSEQIDIVWKI